MSNPAAAIITALDRIGALGGVNPKWKSPISTGGAQKCMQVGSANEHTGTIRSVDMTWLLETDPPEGSNDDPPEVPVISPSKLVQELGILNPSTSGRNPRRLPPPGIAERWEEGVWPDSSRVVGTRAFYLPIHHYAEKWGIVIFREGVELLRSDLMAAASSASRVDSEELVGRDAEFIRAAILTLFHHEFFHHKSESFATRRELELGRGGRYNLYSHEVYRRQLLTPFGPNEEALANAYMFRMAGKARLARDIAAALQLYLPWSFKSQGPGYRRAEDYFDDEAFARAEAYLMSEIDTGPFITRRKKMAYWAEHGSLEPLVNDVDFTGRVWVYL